MSFIPVAMGNAKEDELVPKGKYDLECVSAKYGPSKSSGKPMISCVIQISNPPDNVALAAPIFHYLSIPVTPEVVAESDVELEEDDEPTMTRKARDLRRFMVAFGISYEAGGFEVEDMEGATAQGIQVDIDASDKTRDPSHRLMLDRVTDEQAATFMGGGAQKGGKRRRGRA
tara:strand:- start:5175 stop:5690 length:516 start_codon:yes stop_codon:yes gene_type:complete